MNNTKKDLLLKRFSDWLGDRDLDYVDVEIFDVEFHAFVTIEKRGEMMTNIKKTYESIGLEKLFTCSATAKIIDVLWEYQNIDLTLTDISDEAGIHYTTLMKTLTELEKYGLVTMTRQVGNAKLYQINKDDIVVKRLVKFLNSLNIRFAEQEIVQQKMPL